MDWSQQSIRLKPQWLTLITLMLLLLVAGCSKVTKPTSDSTPPTLRWHIINKADNSTQDISGSGTIAAHMGDFYVVTFFAEDQQGIHKISLSSNVFWQCASGDTAQNHGPSLGVTNSQTLQPDSQGNVLTSIFLIENADISGFDCQSGYTFNGGSLAFSGQGENYFNGTTQGELVFNVSP
jgi:hypothetical protein